MSRPGAVKKGQDAQGQVLWQLFRMMVLAATAGWSEARSVNRGRVAAALGTSESVINGYMSPGDSRMPTLVQFHRLLTHESLVAPEVKGRVGTRLMLEWGVIGVRFAGVAVPLESVPECVTEGALGVSAAAGGLSAEVLAAVADGRIDETERGRIMRRAHEAAAAVGAVGVSLDAAG